MSEKKSFDDKFDGLFKRMDSLLDRFSVSYDGLFHSNDSMFHTVETTELPEEDPNAQMEYLVKDVFLLNRNDGLEASLNSLGEDGWDLIHYDGDKAIFSRIAE